MPQNILFIGRGTHLTCGAGHQARALMENEGQLKAAGFDLTFEHALSNEELIQKGTLRDYDAVLLLVAWRDSVDEVCRTLEKIRKGQRGKLAFIDYTDQSCSPHWAALPLVDHFIKPHLLSPIDNYGNTYEGGYIFTDFLKRQMNYELEDWYFHSPLDFKYADRIQLGWNMASLERYRRISSLGNRFTLAFRFRPVDINLRFTVGNYQNKSAWYTKYRQATKDIVKTLKRRRFSGEERLPFKRYLLDLSLSKIVVSPFGWGEVCYRDYEAVACGSLLIKPSMEHLITEPNIFIPNKTYVPVRWDLSDLKEKCDYYLNHPAQAQQIIANASRAFQSFFHEQTIVKRMAEILGQGH